MSATTTTIGNTEVFGLTSTLANRRAIPVTFSDAGTINSISIYHNGGTGNVLLGVYSDLSGSPSSRLGVTASTVINSTAGWQTVSLATPVNVTSGQTIWLSWVFQNNPGVRYTSGTPARAQSTETWSTGMPPSFGTSSFDNYSYSVYCTYTVNKTILKEALIPENEHHDPALPISLKSDNKTTINLSFENSVNPLEVNEFKLYPNPANSFVNVDYSEMPVPGTTIEIIDNNGRTLYKKPVESTSNRIDISQLPVGLYFIRSISNQKYNVKKMIVK